MSESLLRTIQWVFLIVLVTIGNVTTSCNANAIAELKATLCKINDNIVKD